MQIVILADELCYHELIVENSSHTITRVNELNDFNNIKADAFIDLQFNGDSSRIDFLNKLPAHIIINSVPFTLKETGENFIRINGWSTFLNKPVIEAAGKVELQEKAKEIFHALNKTIEWVPDTPGFITPRILSMIINEAFYTLGEGVSSKKEIDTAMKLGTGYPFGPFEWSELIGLENVNALLLQLSKMDQKYSPAPELIKQLNEWS